VVWDSWGSERVQSAYDFLRTGITPTYFGGTGCTSSAHCAAGYACISGRCRQISGAGGGTGGSTGSGGTCGTGADSGPSGGAPGEGGGCASPAGVGGPSAPVGCTVTTCGEDYDAGAYGIDSDCCGERCCRFYSLGLSLGLGVQCYCGKCPGWTGDRCSANSDCASGVCENGFCKDAKPCVKYCDEYYATHGSEGEGCSDTHCDECEECAGTYDNGGNYCTGKASPPCHCNPESVPDCSYCAADGTIIPGECLTCCQIDNLDCGCGIAVSARSCHPRDNYSGPSPCNLARAAAEAECEKQCGGPGAVDECAGVCQSTTVCVDGAQCSNPDGPGAAADGVNRTVTGCIEAGGKTCWLVDDCDVSNVPEKCKGCDCNCNNDCPECQICGADGKCAPDPNCCPGGKTKCGTTCCADNASCYQPTIGVENYSCCASPANVQPVYRNTYDTGDGGAGSVVDTIGPIRWSTSPSCINCNGTNVLCSSGAARPQAQIENVKFSGCTQGALQIAYVDPVGKQQCSGFANLPGIGFPKVTKTELIGYICCS
jgi:hypothetical protein